MDLFVHLFFKLMPLYMNIALGYIAGKTINTSRDTIAKFMFYMINPLIIFNGVLSVKLTTSILSLPLITFFLSTFICLAFFFSSRRLWNDSSLNLMAFSAGTGNTGYFGLPLALLLFDDVGEGIYILALLGITFYENSVGFYVLAKGIHPAKECLRKLVTLPATYAFFGGLALNGLGVPIPQVFAEFMGHIKGTYTVLGMLIIGLGLSGLHHMKLDMVFVGMTFLAKFIVWPLAIFTLIAFESHFIGSFTPAIQKALILLSIVPIAVNTVILATIVKSEPEKAATAVVLSTLFALIYVPIMTTLFITPL